MTPVIHSNPNSLNISGRKQLQANQLAFQPTQDLLRVYLRLLLDRITRAVLTPRVLAILAHPVIATGERRVALVACVPDTVARLAVDALEGRVERFGFGNIAGVAEAFGVFGELGSGIKLACWGIISGRIGMRLTDRADTTGSVDDRNSRSRWHGL